MQQIGVAMTIHASLTKSFGEFELKVEFSAPSRGVTGLLGPSGSGKTSLLRCIAGLERAAGTFSIGDEIWQDRMLFTPAHRRPVGYVFQEASLFDHLSVHDNIMFGRKRTRLTERKWSLDLAVELLGIGNLLGRETTRLSGGERQRVAIARALMSSPRLLLMDEPLSSLDHDSKEELLPFLARIHRELDVPVIYVSHSVDEIARLADFLVLMQRGQVIAADDIHDVMTGLDLPLALSADSESILEAVVAEHDEKYYLTHLEFPGGRLTVSRLALKPGNPVRVRLAARDVSLTVSHASDTSILNIFPALVEEISITTDMSQLVVRLNLNGAILLARITRKSADQLNIKPGCPVFAQIKSVSVLF